MILVVSIVLSSPGLYHHLQSGDMFSELMMITGDSVDKLLSPLSDCRTQVSGDQVISESGNII